MSLEFLRKKEFVWLITLVIFFLILRVPAINTPYHQDEYKWVFYSHTETTAQGTIPHPPLTEFVYTKLGPIVGDNNFRFIPLTFSLVNLFLIFYLAKIIFDPFDKLRASKTAFWVSGLFSVSFYSVLASTMVDVDGAVMAFFFLILSISYFELKKRNFQFSISNFQNWTWVALLILGAIGGFLTKMSGVLPLGAFALDFAIIKGFFYDKKKFIKFLGLGAGLALGVVAILLLAKIVFPFFPIEKSITYWKHFANSSSFVDRGWLQTFIQFAKSILYLSPLLVLPAFFTDKEVFKKLRPFFFFIFIGLCFYLFAFDFSIGALDRYFQFLIVPLCVIVGAVFAKFFSDDSEKIEKVDLFSIGVIAVSVFALQFFNQIVPTLYPKTEWLNRIISLHWNFLYPFSGGSGPLPFYVSFVLIGLVWVCAIILMLPAIKITGIKKRILFGVLILGIIYNAVFIEEYLFGKINGSAKNLVFESTSYIVKNEDIKKVAVYNDNGGFNVRQTDKYERRIYATPQFENTYVEFFKDFKGHVLFIDIPKIDKNSMYAKYFNSCKKIYEKKDKYITAKVLDCRK